MGKKKRKKMWWHKDYKKKKKKRDWRKWKKDSKLPFRKAIEILKLKPEQVLHVGDWPERDIKVPKSLGMKTCLANYGYKAHKLGKYYKGDYTIDRFEEIMGVIL